MAKAKKTTEEKFEKTEFNLFEALTALDKKDYDYFDRLTPEQQKKFNPYLLIQWISSVKGSRELQEYYLRSVDYYANRHLLDYMLASAEHRHPKLQWLMMCASSPGLGSQFHQWIPSLGSQSSKLRVDIKEKDVKEYYKKIYPKTDESKINDISKLFLLNHKKKRYLATIYPSMKVNDIEILSDMVTDEELSEYDRKLGN